MNRTKLNYQIWMLANAIQRLSNADGSNEDIAWISKAIESIEEVLQNLKDELPF